MSKERKAHFLRAERSVDKIHFHPSGFLCELPVIRVPSCIFNEEIIQ